MTLTVVSLLQVYICCMKIQFCSVGKSHEAYIKQGIEDFTLRVSKYFPAEWILIQAPKNAASLSETELKDRKQN